MSLRQLLHYKKPFDVFVRHLNLQEHHGKKILQDAQIKIQPFGVARNAEEAFEHAKRLGGNEYVVKAQILAGGRGKGKFDNGFKGGVHVVSTPEEAMEKARQMIGYRLITKQTTSQGQLCEYVMVAKSLNIRREYYFSITLDRLTNGPILIGSSCGGVDIEEIAASNPDAIIKVPIDIHKGITTEIESKFAEKMGFEDSLKDQAVDMVKKLYDLFVKTDCNLLEINPLIEDSDGNVVCMDCKINLDTNAGFRQKGLFALKDNNQEDELEVRASNSNLNYIRLDGNIGCLVNGAGLAMATMDIIKLHGGEPANFLDVGGGATVDQVTEAFKIITADQGKVHAILVNIFGGIMRCDIIAQGIIKAASELNLKIPIVVRLQGTCVNEAKDLIEKAKMQILTCDSLEQATQLAVNLSSMTELAEEAHVGIKVETAKKSLAA